MPKLLSCKIGPSIYSKDKSKIYTDTKMTKIYEEYVSNAYYS